MNKILREGEKQASRQAEDCYTVKHHTHTGRKTTDQHRTADTRRLDRETNEGNEGDTGGATETMIRAHGTINKQQAMCSTHRDIWWPARAHQQDRDKEIVRVNWKKDRDAL